MVALKFGRVALVAPGATRPQYSSTRSARTPRWLICSKAFARVEGFSSAVEASKYTVCAVGGARGGGRRRGHCEQRCEQEGEEELRTRRHGAYGHLGAGKVAVFVAFPSAMGIPVAPDDIVQTPEQGEANSRPPLLVLDPLGAFLDAHGIGEGEIVASPIGDGHSNVTYLIERGGSEVVLRRPPRPPLPPSAHDVLREARLLKALEGTEARVPKVLAVCADEATIGSPFYVMERVLGEVIVASVPERLDSPAERRRIGEQLIDSLVEIHAVDWRAAGLEDFGKPTGYLERQLRRFNGLWELNKTREIEAVESVGSWLAEHLPDSGPATIVHGDYRLGNTHLRAPGPRPPAGGAGLGDGHDRRSPGRRGLPVHDVDRAVGPRKRAARAPRAGYPGRGLSHPRGADRPLRGGLGALDEGRTLVHDARAVEEHRVHGGQLQARPGRHHR